MRFRIAHLSDCHFTPEVWPTWQELMSKRVVGYVNWHLPVGRGPFARAKHHDMMLLGRIFDDIKAQEPDHCVLTGDLVNFSLSSEFCRAAEYLKGLGNGEYLTCIPGNHDAYVRGSEIHWEDFFSPWMQGDHSSISGEKLCFPFVRMRGPVALIGLSSAVPTPPFASYGALGNQQLEKACCILEDLKKKGIIRVVLIHHPPHHRRFRIRTVLADSNGFVSVLKSAGAELVLHGHTHKASVAYVVPDQSNLPPIPIIGVPSASGRYDSPLKRAGYNLIDLSHEKGEKPRWTVSLRIVEGDTVREHSKISLEMKGKIS